MSLSDLDELLDPAYTDDSNLLERRRSDRRTMQHSSTSASMLRTPSSMQAAQQSSPQPNSQNLLRPGPTILPPGSPPPAPSSRRSRAALGPWSPGPARVVRSSLSASSSRALLGPPPTAPPPGSPPPVPFRRDLTRPCLVKSPSVNAESSQAVQVRLQAPPSAQGQVQLSEPIILDPPVPSQGPTAPSQPPKQPNSSSAIPRPVKPSLKIQTHDVPRPTTTPPSNPKETRFKEAITALSSSSSGTASSFATLQGSATPPSTSSFQSKVKAKLTSRQSTPHPSHHQDNRRLSFFPTPVTPLCSLRFPRSFGDARRLLRRECNVLPRLLRRRDRVLLLFIALMLLTFGSLIGVTARRRDVMCRPGKEWVVEGLNAFGPSLVVGGPYTLIVVLLAVSRWGRREIAGCGASHEGDGVDVDAAEQGRGQARRSRSCCERAQDDDEEHRESWWKRTTKKCWSERGGGRYTGLLYAVAVSLIRVAISALMANLEWKIVDCSSFGG